MSNCLIKPLVAGLLLSHVVLPVAWSAETTGVLVHNKAVDVTRDKVMQEFSLQPEELQAKLKRNELAFRKFVDAVNNELLFEVEANKQNLKADPVVAQKIEIAIRKVLIMELIARKNAEIKVPDMEPLALAEYKAHPEKHMGEESVNARHILVTFDANNKADKAEKIALVQSIAKRVSAGEPFAALAKQYSADKGSAEKGGELGVFTRGKTVKPFEEAAFALKKPNQLSGPVESQFGLHLIQLIEHTPPKRLAFDAIKADLIETMRQEYIKNEVNRWRDSILDAKNAVLNHAEIEKLLADVKKLP